MLLVVFCDFQHKIGGFACYLAANPPLVHLAANVRTATQLGLLVLQEFVWVTIEVIREFVWVAVGGPAFLPDRSIAVILYACNSHVRQECRTSYGL